MALALSAALFGAMHLGNPGATVLASGAVALEAGVLLGAVFVLSRRLWAPIGLHMGWNFAEGGIFGVAVSGHRAEGLVTASVSGPEWLTGGAFGIEASAVAVVVCSAAATLMLLMAIRRARVMAPRWRRASRLERA